MKKAVKKQKPSKKKVKSAQKKPSKVSKKKQSVKPQTRSVAVKEPMATMDDFQQCLVLAAVINAKRSLNPKFLEIPLPDINSSAFSPLREQLGKYQFEVEAIKKAVTHLLNSKEFKTFFPVEDDSHANPLSLSGDTKEGLIKALLNLAGPEARKKIYIRFGKHHYIYEWTLEDYAEKIGAIEKMHHDEKSSWSQALASKKPDIFVPGIHKSFEHRKSLFNLRKQRGRG